MQWYLIYPERLEAEISLMRDNGVNFTLWQDCCGNLLWRGSLSILGHYHGDVRLVYPEYYPEMPIVVYVLEPKLPMDNVHIHEDGSICYIKPDEWYPDWNAYWVYLTTIRFLREYYSGKMSRHSFSYTPTQKGLLDQLMEALGL